ncbi:MAG: hypothetical protein AB6733_03725 [Clostridiaceae bacterium]
MKNKGRNDKNKSPDEKDVLFQNENIQKILNDINELVKTPYDNKEFLIKINEIVTYLVEDLSKLETLKRLYENENLNNSISTDNTEDVLSENNSTAEVELTSTTNNTANCQIDDNRQPILPPNLLVPNAQPILTGSTPGGVTANSLMKKKIAAETALIEETLKLDQTTSTSLSNTTGGATDITGTTVNASTSTSAKLTPSDVLTGLTDAITKINLLKVQLCRLPLNFCENEYITICILPLLGVLASLAGVSISLASSFSILFNNSFIDREKHKIKKYIHTTYDINDQICHLYEVVGKRIDKIIDCAE